MPVAAQPEAGAPETVAIIGEIPDIDPAAFDTLVPNEPAPLFLKVDINGRDTGLIAEFTLDDGGRLVATAAELEEVGLRASGRNARLVHLDELAGVSYHYDDLNQTLSVTASPHALLPREIPVRSAPEYVEPDTGYGAVLNYRVAGNLGDDLLEEGVRLKSLFAPFEARLFAPIGVLTTTGHMAANEFDFETASFQRHDTQFVYSNPRRLLEFTAGDTVSSSLPWTRPVRIGGVQLQRDFSLRSDVITSPLLSYSGVAAVPSTIDLYVDNVRTWSGRTETGPFVVRDLPLITSRGEALFVLHDEAGNETVTRVPFFATRDLLQKGRLDFSVEAGWAREDFGISNFAYGDDALAAGTLRYGLADTLTLQGHLEHTSGLFAGSVGATMALLNRVEVTMAAGASDHAGAQGYLTHLSFRSDIGNAEIRFTSTRTFGEYRDLTYVTGLDAMEDMDPQDLARLAPADAQDAFSLSIPMGDAQLGLNYVHSKREDRTSSIISASYTQKLDWQDSTLSLNGFKDIHSGDVGIAASLTIPLGGRASARAGINRSQDGGYRTTIAAARRLDQEIGSGGYAAEVTHAGDDDLGARASAAYRSRYGMAEAELRHETSTGRSSASASIEGAVVAAGGGLFAGNRVTDAFAVVDVGVPNVPVELHNRPVGRTGASGKALIPNLQSYRNNRISVDPNALPLDAVLDATATNVVPARRSGVSVSFGASPGTSALVVLRMPNGEFVAAGSTAILNSEGEAIAVGYDGEIWLEELRPENQLVVSTARGTCTATFGFRPTPGDITIIDPVECT